MILVATIAFPRNRRHCALLQLERHAVSKGSYDMRGPCACLRHSSYCGDDSERAFVVSWLAALLRRGELCGPLRRHRP